MNLIEGIASFIWEITQGSNLFYIKQIDKEKIVRKVFLKFQKGISFVG